MKKTLKIICLGVLALSFLWGCGREERQRGIDGCFFEAEPLAQTEELGCNFKSDGKWLYYIGEGSSLFRLPVEEENRSKAEKFPGGEGILDYAVDAEGNTYLYKAAIKWLSDSMGLTLTDGTLIKCRTDGSQIFQLSLDSRSASYMRLYSVPGFLATGGRNQVFLLNGDEILAIDETGNIVGELPIGPNRPQESFSAREQLLEGGDGRVYYLLTDTSQQTVYEVANSGESYHLQSMSGNDWQDKTSLMGTFYGSPWGLLYNGTNGILQQYSPRKGEWQALLRWNDSDLPWGGQEVVSISEDKLMASFVSSTDFGSEFYILNKKSIDELPEKEELVLACLYYCPDALEDAVIFFNRSSDQYHITIQVYDSEDAEIRLDASLLSSNPPDLVDLSNLDVEKYCRKQALEDLTSYMSDSSSLRQEDFLDGVMDGYTVDGRLAGIPSGFTCYTLLGRTSEVGSQTGWTVSDMMSLSRKYPDRKLNGRSFYRNLDDICGNYIMDRFINREKGECDFDSEEFAILVEWLAEHSGSGTEYYDSEDVENPLIFWKNGASILDFLIDFLRPEEEMTLIGYPSIDGRPLHYAWTYNAVGITSKSRNKEGAWQFIEAFLSSETERSLYIPTRQDMLNRLLEDARTPAYETIDGEIQYDTKGNPIETAKWITLSEGQHVYHDCATQEEIDQLLEILSHTDFSPESSLQSEVMSIIAEETASYFRKEKALEDVTGIIQNRVSTLLKEIS